MPQRRKYIVVGCEVDQAEHWLHPDGRIDRDPGSDGQALNVEYIGRLMVELSARGKAGVSPAELRELENRVKHALNVQDFSALTGDAPLTEAERQEILANTTVRIEFESRRPGKHKPDRNIRILVVPSDETLGVTDAMLRAQGQAQGFRPPLSYELDQALILASLRDEILEMVAEFAADPPTGWTAELQQALTAHMERAIAERSQFKDAAGQPAQDVKNQILSSPLRAFHRSVGIYATNMCR
ncbi:MULTISPECIES: hypothetical protein [unclassified Paracoccus (in: a-proteobacteria)]|uniref:hypothetical protein n=1 Tax=unclassified Paracoccus (in: a-proteobacteria) TaxID=2688777 RepID=UPI0012B28543|nr:MULTISPECIES: hypothetical protein [unclassified Paracoccus (in: a-proteobacteria)]UXU76554.1 hypothetical protein GB879_014365 [Paracoccus sp. SMMA_5]UXU82379.1 hypothetical protein GB880_014070 [Paracoccus sp. SMMA_5_TC]